MNKIKEFRKKQKLSQSELAKSVNTKQRNISYWENEKREPKVRVAIKIAQILDTTVEELYK